MLLQSTGKDKKFEKLVVCANYISLDGDNLFNNTFKKARAKKDNITKLDFGKITFKKISFHHVDHLISIVLPNGKMELEDDHTFLLRKYLFNMIKEANKANYAVLCIPKLSEDFSGYSYLEFNAAIDKVINDINQLDDFKIIAISNNVYKNINNRKLAFKELYESDFDEEVDLDKEAIKEIDSFNSTLEAFIKKQKFDFKIKDQIFDDKICCDKSFIEHKKSSTSIPPKEFKCPHIFGDDEENYDLVLMLNDYKLDMDSSSYDKRFYRKYTPYEYFEAYAKEERHIDDFDSFIKEHTDYTRQRRAKLKQIDSFNRKDSYIFCALLKFDIRDFLSYDLCFPIQYIRDDTLDLFFMHYIALDLPKSIMKKVYKNCSDVLFDNDDEFVDIDMLQTDFNSSTDNNIQFRDSQIFDSKHHVKQLGPYNPLA